MRMVPYWLDTAAPFAGAETGPVEGEVEVLVIGGGLTGLSAALARARGGRASPCWSAAKSSGRPPGGTAGT